MKKLFLLISVFSVGIISQAAHISGVKFNNICTQNTGSTDNEDFRNLAPVMIYNGYSENCEIEVNWNSPDYRPNRIQFWIDMNADKKESNNEYFTYTISLSGISGTKVKVSINNFTTPTSTSLKKDAALNMKISMFNVNSGIGRINSELYWITFRSVDFPHITKNVFNSKTINDPNPDFLANFSVTSKTETNLVSFNYTKGVILPGSLTVKRENSNVVPTGVRVYVDFDKNGSYSFSEKIYEKSIPSWGSNVLSKDVYYEFLVPISKSVTYNSAYNFKVEVTNSSGLGEAQQYTVYFKNSTSRMGDESNIENADINDIKLKLDLQMCPNPFASLKNVYASINFSTVEAAIFNLDRVKILSKSIVSENNKVIKTFNTESLANGI